MMLFVSACVYNWRINWNGEKELFVSIPVYYNVNLALE